MTRAEAEARVARGAALLDKKRPGWAMEIDLDTLNMDSPCFCILGQLYGDYHASLDGVCGYGNGCEFGFNVPDSYHFYPGSAEVLRVLQSAWITAILAARRTKEFTA